MPASRAVYAARACGPTLASRRFLHGAGALTLVLAPLLALVPALSVRAAHGDSGERLAATPARAPAEAARQIMAQDPYPTLVSTDTNGQPRARTVEASAPDDDFVVWVATQPNTRKVAQIRAQPRVTLHYANDDAGAYVSVMGTATLHDDAETLRAHTFHSTAALEAFWPDYPENYLLLRIAPTSVEVLGAGIEADARTWRPASFAPTTAGALRQ